MIEVMVNQTVRTKLHSSSIRKAVEFIARHEPRVRGAVEIQLIGERYMQKLNHRFRGQNRVTDVLSFSWREDTQWQGNHLGQLYLCPKYIQRQAKRFGVTPTEEFLRTLVHGLLHLIGYDHQTAQEARRMFSVQERLVDRAGVRYRIHI